MRRVGKSIYDSKAWQRLKDMYMSSKNYICERCGGVATICHHKKYITAANVNDPKITLNAENLEALCQECHNKEHNHFSATNDSKAIFDSKGQMVGFKENAEIWRIREAIERLENTPPIFEQK